MGRFPNIKTPHLFDPGQNCIGPGCESGSRSQMLEIDGPIQDSRLFQAKNASFSKLCEKMLFRITTGRHNAILGL